MTSDRLLKHKNLLNSFKCLLSIKDECMKESYENDIKYLVQKYFEYLPCISPLVVLMELKLWWNYIQTIPKTETNVLNLLKHCTEIDYPNIYKLLTIVATIPITTATPERSFSTLRRLKTYLRNTMGENRLNGLALLNIHREIVVTTDEILDKLSEKKRT